MTSLSRRKRQITVRNTPAGRLFRRAALGAVLAVLAAMLTGSHTQAADIAVRFEASQATATQQVAATPPAEKVVTGLRWLAPRAETGPANDLNRVLPAAAFKPVAKAMPRTDPFRDPFADNTLGARSQAEPSKIKTCAALEVDPLGKYALPDDPTAIVAAPVQNRSTPREIDTPVPLEPKVLSESSRSVPLPANRWRPANGAADALPNANTAAPQPFPTESPIPRLEDQLSKPGATLDRCTSPKDLKAINKITYDIAPPKGGGTQQQILPPECGLGDERFQARAWAPITYTWTASALCHKPLYFEDAQLERYGHDWGPCLQPFMSAKEFFLTFPMLPYYMGLCPPGECQYTLGHYRPGDCAPYMFDPFPLSVRAALVQAGAWTGAVFIF